MEQPEVARYRSSQLRTMSPVSGSRLAVGSSSSSSSGRLMSDFASATRVFCPAESSPAGRSRKSPRLNSSVSSAMRRSVFRTL